MDPFASALTVAAAIKSKEVSSVEVLDACLERVDALNPEINSICWRNDEDARVAAREADAQLASGDEVGPFHGVPIPIKDLTPVEGWPVTHGSHGAPEGPSGESELVVDALQRAGFVLCGRTTTPEFGVITATETLRHGITRNPWDLDRTSGGSSGGASATTASGMFPIAHANDGGGSIRIPASCAGLVGLKPSRGRVPRLAQSWFGAVVEGVVTHDVADTAAVLDAISGPDPLCWYNAPAPDRHFAAEPGESPGRLRFGVLDAVPLGLPQDEACTAAVAATTATLESLGHEVLTVSGDLLPTELVPYFVVMINSGLADYDGIDWDKVEPHNQVNHRNAAATDSLTLAASVRALERASRDIVGRFGREFDVLLSPTIASEPAVAGTMSQLAHSEPEAPSVPVLQSVCYAALANITGLPAISLPLHTTEAGLPIGVMFTGGPFNEVELLRLAAQLEEARPWKDRRPALAVA